MIEPRISKRSRGDIELAKKAIDLAGESGLKLDDWQQLVLGDSLRLHDDGKWDARELGLCVARQNGKDAILEARELAEVALISFLNPEPSLIIHSAHNFSTAAEHFHRLESRIEDSPTLKKLLKGIRRRGGEEGFTFTNGARIHFRTRTKGGARGFSVDLLVLNEAMFLPEFAFGSIFPTLRARHNPQVWYAGSAVDQAVHPDGVVFARIRDRAVKGKEGRYAYYEWSVEGDNPEGVPLLVLHDRSAWAQANPALGVRIDPDSMEQEGQSLYWGREFAVELLGIGDWPRTDHIARNPISLEAFLALEDPLSKIAGGRAFAFDVSPERRASISVAGVREDGLLHVEVIEDRSGTKWVAKRLAELRKHKPVAVVCDGYGGAASLIPEIEEEGIEIQTLTALEHSQACSRLVDLVDNGTLRHIGQGELTNALRVAATRPLGDAWAWSRKSSSANISPLVSSTLALSAVMTEKPRKTSYAWA